MHHKEKTASKNVVAVRSVEVSQSHILKGNVLTLYPT